MKPPKRQSPRLTPRQFGFAGACALAAVLAHLPHLPWSVSAPALAILLARWAQRWRGEGAWPLWIKLPLLAIFPALVIVHYGNIFGRDPGSALACAMLTLKLLETETRRDALAVVCFASFVLMSALLFDTSLGFTLALFAALTLPLATLRELEPRAAPTAPHWRSIWASLRSGLIALGLAAPVALCAFVFLPRLDSPLWRTSNDTSARTGLAETMTPGAMQQLLIDDSPAFRVDFDGALPPRNQLYWRGLALTDFDGATWRRRNPRLTGRNNGTAPPQTSGAQYDYRVTLEASDRPWLFALDIPTRIPDDALRGSDMSLMRVDARNGQPLPVTSLFQYRLRSAPHYLLDASLSDRERRAALALPKDFNPRSIALARRWREERGGDDDALVKAALDYFHASFTYTLAAPPLGRDAVDDFLFGTQRGFCEHYAAAFVVLMRAAGIPARVVTGYLGGYYNTAGNYLLVRQSDAHAWAEVWLRERGWVRIDPTAAVSPQRVELSAQEAASAGADAPWQGADWLLALRNRLDVVNHAWNAMIVRFDALRQRDLLAWIGIGRADQSTLVWLLIGTGGTLLALFAFWAMRAPRRPADPLDAAYDALCAKVARAGVVRGSAEGPQDYARRLGALPATDFTRQAQVLLARHVSLRYASALTPTTAVREFARAVRRLPRARA